MSHLLEQIIGRNVFIIEDEVDLCMLLKACLLKQNCQVRIAHTLDDALYSMKQEMPDVVLLSSNLCEDIKEAGNRILEAAPGAWVIVSGESRANKYFDYF